MYREVTARCAHGFLRDSKLCIVCNPKPAYGRGPRPGLRKCKRCGRRVRVELLEQEALQLCADGCSAVGVKAMGGSQ